ncbi:MAG TPA: hypothetical protein PLP42_05490 [Acidobacteriota bacterium]|nr:hypothetical protein [Acidobacteriota bacterium]
MRKPISVWFALSGLLLASVLILANSPQDFTLKYAFKNADGSVFRLVHNYMADGVKYRVDYLDPKGAANLIKIYRKDKGVYWSCNPTNKTYVESKLDETEWSYAMIGVFVWEEDKQKKTGETEFLGRSCEVFATERAGFTTTLHLLQGTNLVLRSELREKEKLLQILETVEFQQEQPAASLFELPAGYKKVEGQ